MTKYPVGQQQWEGFPSLGEPAKLMGVDRILMILFATFSYAMFVAVGFQFAVVFSLVGYFTLRTLCDLDPHALSVLKSVAEYSASPWYDYDNAPGPLALGAIIQPPLEAWPLRDDSDG